MTDFSSSKQQVFDTLAKVPRGKVITYKQLAQACNISNPRQIGRIIHKNQDPKKYPCHRVVRSDGTLADGYAFGGKQAQVALLISEGIIMKNDKISLLSFGYHLN